MWRLRGFLLGVLLVGVAAAQETGGWVGKRVVLGDGAKLHAAGKVIEPDGGVYHVYHVDQANGPWLGLISERDGVRGWARATEVRTLEHAIARLNERLRTDPGDVNARYERGALRAFKGEHDLALADFSEVIRIDPKYVEAYQARAVVFFNEGQYERSISDCSEAIRLRPGDSTAYHNRGSAWERRGEYARAIADASEALRLNPGDAGAYSNRALARRGEKDYAGAIADYDRAIRIAPQSAQFHADRASTWRAMGQYAKALADYGLAVKLDPKFPWARQGRAWLRATCPEARYRNGRAAQADARFACEMTGWKDPACLATLAAACAESGGYILADRWQKRALGRLARGERGLEAYRAALEGYRRRQPYRGEPGWDVAYTVF